MEPTQRARFNADFSPARYEAYLHCVQHTERWPADFRICETPVFLTREFTDGGRCANEIVALTRTPGIRAARRHSHPQGWKCLTNLRIPTFSWWTLAFAEEGGRLTPRLIELQAFPSLYGFQFLLLGCMRQAFPAIPREWTSAFSGLKDESYLSLSARSLSVKPIRKV